MCKKNFKIIYLLTYRIELIDLVKSLYSLLIKDNILILPIFTDYPADHQQKIELENVFIKEGIEFKNLDNYYFKTAIQFLGDEKPDFVITDNDLLNITHIFILSSKRMNIPVLLIRESVTYVNGNQSARVTVGSQNFSAIINNFISKLDKMPKYIKMFSFFLRSISLIEPTLILNTKELMQSFMFGFSGYIYGSYSDYILSNTSKDAEILREKCPRVKKIFVVGNPRYDNIKSAILDKSLIETTKQKVCSLNHIPLNKKIVLFLSSSHLEHQMVSESTKLKMNKQLLEIFYSFNEKIFFIIKLHPIEKNIFPKIWKNEYNKSISVIDINLDDAILISDLVVTWPSTAMLNVVITNKPLIMIDFMNFHKVHGLIQTDDILKLGASLEANSGESLKLYINSFLNDDKIWNTLFKNQLAFKNEYLNYNGKSLELIKNHIITLLKKTT